MEPNRIHIYLENKSETYLLNFLTSSCPFYEEVRRNNSETIG